MYVLGLILPLLIFLIYTINILYDGNIKKKIIKPLILFLILTPFLIILFWPYSWANPIEHFLYTLKISNFFKKFQTNKIFFSGHILSIDRLECNNCFFQNQVLFFLMVYGTFQLDVAHARGEP